MEADTITWANELLASKGKSSEISGFKDKNLATSLPVLDLIDAVKPGSINTNHVNMDPKTEDEKYFTQLIFTSFLVLIFLYLRLSNAKLAISMTRKIGAPIYALPEDLVEGKHQMIMTIFVCIKLIANKRFSQM